MTAEMAETAGELAESTDVLVVGGGIAGVSTLFHLARYGVGATLVERGRVAGGATDAAAGVLTPPLRQPYHETVHDRGAEKAREIWSFAQRSVAGMGEALTEIGAAEEAQLDLSGGHVLAEPHTKEAVRRSYAALSEAGFPVSWLDRDGVEEACGARGLVGGYRMDGGGAMSPGPATRALARWAASRGCSVVEGTHVREVVRGEDGLVCRTETGEIRARMVVYATHIDSRPFSALVGDEVVPIRGQGLRARVPGLSVRRGCFATHWKMNVWRQAPDGTLHLSGWRHNAWDRSYWKTRPELDERLQEDLETWVRTAFPGAKLEITDRWSGIFGWTSDYLPLVGPLPGAPDEMVITGFSGGGLPFAFESGRILAAAIAGKEPVPGARLFNPRRFL